MDCHRTNRKRARVRSARVQGLEFALGNRYHMYILKVWGGYLKKGLAHISAQRFPSITGNEPRQQFPKFTVFRACSVLQYGSTKIQLV